MDQRLQKVTHFNQIATLMWLGYVTPEEVLNNPQLRWIALDEYFQVYYGLEISIGTVPNTDRLANYTSVFGELHGGEPGWESEVTAFETWMHGVAGGLITVINCEGETPSYNGAELLQKHSVLSRACRYMFVV
jgi:hypothetical protein